MYHGHIMKNLLLFVTGLLLGIIHTAGQTLDLTMTTGSNVDFVFNTISKYSNGVILPNSTRLRVESTVEWDLYVGVSTTTAGNWDILTTYSPYGSSTIPVSLLELRFTNVDNTSQQVGFFGVSDISTPTYIIGSTINDPTTSSGVGTNVPGDHLSNPNTHRFRVDFRIVPGLIYRPGLYSLTIDYTLVEDL